jgi:AcrR family transcriptional regulator
VTKLDGFAKRRERKKESIRLAAQQLFMDRGFRAVSIAEIAALAGVSQVSIYNYFGSKEKLAIYVIDQYMAEQLQVFTDIIESPQPFLVKLEKAFFQSAKAYETIHMEFIDTFISSDPKIAKLLVAYEEKLFPYMIKFIEQGWEEGYFNKDLSQETLLFYFNLFSSQAMQQLEKMPKGEKKRRVYNELLSVFFYGVRGEGEN